MQELYELKEKLCEELEKYGEEELTAGSLEVVDKLAHAVKNICKIIEAKEMEEYSMDGGMSMAYARGGNQGGGRGGQGGGQSNRGGSYARANGSYARGNGGGGSYARGRGSNARRDSMGRYSSESGYSGNDEMISELYELMEEAPDEKTRKEFEKFVKKIEMM